MPPPASLPADDLLKALSADFLGAIDAVSVPAYIVDLHRRVQWQNAASIRLVGDLRGRLDDSVLAPGDLGVAREAFTRKQKGASHAELQVSVMCADGKRVRCGVNTVPLKNADGAMIGSFGLVQVLEDTTPSSTAAPRLSPRERETLTLLAAGHSTSQMAQEMHIATETVRNHVKRVLRTLDARSRVEAVAKARQVGLL